MDKGSSSKGLLSRDSRVLTAGVEKKMGSFRRDLPRKFHSLVVEILVSLETLERPQNEQHGESDHSLGVFPVKNSFHNNRF